MAVDSLVFAVPSAKQTRFVDRLRGDLAEQADAVGVVAVDGEIAASASSLRGISSIEPLDRFDSSAYWATIRSVFFSPLPPIMIGMREIGAGELTASVTW